MNNKNINWINAVKALCIIFVFLRHSGSYYGTHIAWLNCWYLPFYVNAFFFVSGYLLFRKQLSVPRIEETAKVYISKNGSGRYLLNNIVFRIMIPSVLFATLEYFPKKLIKGDVIDAGSLFFETIGGLTYWFTSALVIAELLFMLLMVTRERSVWFYAFIALFITSVGKHVLDSSFSLFESHGSFPWQWKHGLLSTIFMAAGGIYWKYESIIRKFLKGWIVLLLTATYLFLSIYFYRDLYDGYMTSMLLIHPIGVLWSIFASILLIELCHHIPENRPLTFIGQNSIGFYFLSGALPMTLGILCKKLPITPNIGILLAIWLIALALAYGIVAMFNCYAPWVWDLRKMRTIV